MKHISTTVNTGDSITYNNMECKIGTVKSGKIQFTTILSNTSVITEWISTRELNKRIAAGQKRKFENAETITE